MTLRRAYPRLAQQGQRSQAVKSSGEFASPATGGPRFYVRADTGSVRVVDRDYCHRDIATFTARAGETTYIPIDVCRRLAAIRCAELNAWHAEQMQDAA